MTINMKGFKTEQCEITVSKQELLYKASKHLNNKDLYLLLERSLHKEMGLPVVAYKDGMVWYEDIENYTSHSYTTKSKIRDVVDKDLIFIQMLENFKALCVDKG
jgi:hypothetical protein